MHFMRGARSRLKRHSSGQCRRSRDPHGQISGINLLADVRAKLRDQIHLSTYRSKADLYRSWHLDTLEAASTIVVNPIIPFLPMYPL